MEALAYYANQSPITDPGEMARHLGDLPHDLAGLQRIARGLVLHYRADNPSAHGIPENRLTEVDSRPLAQPRPPQTRLLGCCRDCTVLYLTMARQLRIPARARVGFATYFVPGPNLDHEVAEVWDAGQARWRLVDPELGDDHADPSDGFQVDPQDVPEIASWSPARHGRRAAQVRQIRRRFWSIQGSMSRTRRAGPTCVTTSSMTWLP
jgi:hypothetical protein